MRLARFCYKDKICFGVVSNDEIIVAKGDIFGEYKLTKKKVPLSSVKLLPPTEPSKIVAVGLNYKAHTEEFGENVPDEPRLFLKPASAVVGHKDDIIIPEQSRRVDYEAELAIVIGKKCSKISEEEAVDYILGFTCLNDVTARDLQRKDGQWTRAKGFDTFAPIGPWIETELNPDSVSISLLLNGEVMQSSNTNMFIFKTRQLVSYISNVMSLLPGDIITTGTPSGVGPIKSGDVVMVKIDGIGELINNVK